MFLDKEKPATARRFSAVVPRNAQSKFRISRLPSVPVLHDPS
jgi:hypothetical protein